MYSPYLDPVPGKQLYQRRSKALVSRRVPQP